jgi:enamine deaminase RidA (YjgF/YER057c/UK114 family)
MSMAETSIRRIGVTQRWSDAVIHNDVAYFVEVPDDSTQDVQHQFIQLFKQVEQRLAEIGSDLTRLLQVIVYLPDPGDLAVFNELWDAWIPAGHAPSRACIHASLAAKDYRVELVITAAVSRL